MLYEHPDKRLPRAVMFRDSFAIWLIPLLSREFQPHSLFVAIHVRSRDR